MTKEQITLPNLIIIGAMKCDSTSLHAYLDMHPEIQMSDPKELNFFSKEEIITRDLRGTVLSSRKDLNTMVNTQSTIRNLRCFQRLHQE